MGADVGLFLPQLRMDFPTIRDRVHRAEALGFGVGAEHGVLQPGACAQGQERGERTQSRKRPRATCHRYRFAASAS